MEERTRTIMALSIVGLYISVVLILLLWSIISDEGDLNHYFVLLNNTNFLLWPVGFVMGYYFKK